MEVSLPSGDPTILVSLCQLTWTRRRRSRRQTLPKITIFNLDLAELYKFHIAALIEGDNSIYWSPLF